MAIPMGKKSDAYDGVMQMITRMKRAQKKCNRFHSDQGKEFLAINVRRFLRLHLVWQTHTAGDDPRNGLAEVCVSSFKTKGRTLMSAASNLEHKYWPYAIKHLDYLYTKMHTNLVEPSILDNVEFGQEMVCKMRNWKKDKSSLKETAEDVTFLGQDLQLSGEGD